MVINVGDKTITRKHGLNETLKMILSKMRYNLNITNSELVALIGISNTAIDNNIRYLRRKGFIERIGENKNGYWRVIDKD